MVLWQSAILFMVGLGILIRGSDFFVGSAAFIAKRFGVSELIIGLTLVSMGTSFPELGASVYASYSGNGGIAVGNVVGSNIANIALVLGACLILRGLKVNRKMLTRDGVIMLGVSILFTLMVFKGVVRWEGLILVVIFAVYLGYLFKQNKDEKKRIEELKSLEESLEKEHHLAKLILRPRVEDGTDEDAEEGEGEDEETSLMKVSLKLVAGCVGVILGAWLMVEMAVEISTEFNIPQTVIGSTLVAFGTSVPELAVSMVAIWKRYEQISIGNIIGSNIFNILLVIGAAALVNPLDVDDTLLYTNIPIMLMVAALLLIFMAAKNRLMRWQGSMFVVIYFVFLVMNYW